MCVTDRLVLQDSTGDLLDLTVSDDGYLCAWAFSSRKAESVLVMIRPEDVRRMANLLSGKPVES